MYVVILCYLYFFFFFSSRRRHTRYWRDWSSDVCSSDLRRVHRRVSVGPRRVRVPPDVERAHGDERARRIRRVRRGPDAVPGGPRSVRRRRGGGGSGPGGVPRDRKSTRLNSSHANISYAVFCLKKKK